MCPKNLQLNHCEVDPPFSCYEFVKDSIDCENNTYCFKIKNTSNPGFDLYSVSIYDLTGGLVLSPTGLINIPNAPLASGSTSDWICVTYSGVQTGDNVCYKLAAHNNSPGTPPTQCCTDTLENCFVIPDCAGCCENNSVDLLGYIADIFDNRTLDSCQLCFEMDLDSCDYYFINYGNGDSLSGNGYQTMCYSYPGNGNFDITIKIINYDSFGNICVEADSTINIDIYDCTPDSGCDVSLIKIYNALSSGNGDNLNDRLIIEDYLDCGRVDISIYNRWGQLVWKQANYDNTWKGIGLEGKPLPDGTYFLILGLPDQKNKTHRIKTFIDLRRDK